MIYSRKGLLNALNDYTGYGPNCLTTFKSSSIGDSLSEELDVPFDKRYNHPTPFSSSRYGVRKMELLKTNYNWQLLLKRNLFIYVFKFIQLLLVALITLTVLCHPTLHHDTIDDGAYYFGNLYFSMVCGWHLHTMWLDMIQTLSGRNMIVANTLDL